MDFLCAENERTLALLPRAIELNPSLPIAHLLYGQALILNGKYTYAAADHREKALALFQVDHLFDPLHADPRWAAFVRKFESGSGSQDRPSNPAPASSRDPR